MERDLDLARDHGAPSKDEVPVRIGKDTRKLASIAESSVGQEVRLRSIGCIFVLLLMKRGEPERRRIFGCG
jgi:hypothetical protein